jgi:hypothetical protein
MAQMLDPIQTTSKEVSTTSPEVGPTQSPSCMDIDNWKKRLPVWEGKCKSWYMAFFIFLTILIVVGIVFLMLWMVGVLPSRELFGVVK